jgi:hypothetical protein
MNEFRRMTSGFQEEFRQAMDLSDTETAAPAPTGDALGRTTEGPRLLPQAPSQPTGAEAGGAAPPPPAPTAARPEAVTPPSSAPAEPPAPTPPSAPAYGAAFAADVTPAPGTGPELVTPPRPADHDGDAGSSSAA